MANIRPRVIVPKNVKKHLSLASQVYAKHCELGEKSPLLNMKESAYLENGRYIADALMFHEKAEDLKRQMLIAYGYRDHMLKEVNKMVKATRDILLVLNRENPKSLGEWGFEVNDTPRRKKKVANDDANKEHAIEK